MDDYREVEALVYFLEVGFGDPFGGGVAVGFAPGAHWETLTSPNVSSQVSWVTLAELIKWNGTFADTAS